VIAQRLLGTGQDPGLETLHINLYRNYAL